MNFKKVFSRIFPKFPAGFLAGKNYTFSLLKLIFFKNGFCLSILVIFSSFLDQKTAFAFTLLRTANSRNLAKSRLKFKWRKTENNNKWRKRRERKNYPVWPE